MPPIRAFSASEGLVPPVRNIDSDAPQRLRQELVDLIFHLAEQNPGVVSAERIHRVSCQSMGVAASGQPYGGFRYAVGRDIGRVEWHRVYDLVCRLWPEFANAGLDLIYREGVNRLLSGHGVVWDLDEQGHLRRVLPPPAQAQIDAAMRELEAPQFATALVLINAARDAYDDRPRRDRDACTNAFDSLESVAKVVYLMPAATLYDVLAEVRRREGMNAQIAGILEALNTHRNRNFGHGVPFNLNPAEVDFTYLACISGILLFTAGSAPRSHRR